MAYIDDLQRRLADVSPAAALALSIAGSSYINKAREAERGAREVLDAVGQVVNGHLGQAYSNGVHRAANWGGNAAGAATGGVVLALGAALGAAVAGPLGAAVAGWLVSGVAGAVGAAVAGVVTSVVETIGRWLARALGIDYHSGGTTAGGGTWDRTDHPDGSWERNEYGPDFDIKEKMNADGSYSEHTKGKGASAGYESDYQSDGNGRSHFEARDTKGGFHEINRDEQGMYFGSASSKDTTSDGKSGQHVRTEGPNGAKSDLWFFDRESGGGTREEHRGPAVPNGHGGTTQDTVSVEKDADGNVTKEENKTVTTDDKGNETIQTSTNGGEPKTESTDKNGDPNNPPQPPPDPPAERDNPEGNGSERPRKRPGQVGRGRPGHPLDEVVPPGSWKKDNGEWEGEQPPDYRDVLAAMALVVAPYRYTGHGDAADEEARLEALRRQLATLDSGGGRQTGEDFIHPKAQAGLLNTLMRSTLG